MVNKGVAAGFRPLSAFVAASAVLGLSACPRVRDNTVAGPATPPAASSRAPELPIAAPSGSTAPLPDVHAWVDKWPTSWNDPRVVDALAADCDFRPTHPASETVGRPAPLGINRPADVFACLPELETGYSGGPDPCLSDSSSCANACTSTCLSCNDSCGAACKGCEGTCRDEACRKSCAQANATCRDRCAADLAHCSSPGCRDAYSACRSKLRDLWRSNHCEQKCAAYLRCEDACSSTRDVTACQERCEQRHDPQHATCTKQCLNAPVSGPNGRTEQELKAVDACLAACPSVPCSAERCLFRIDFGR